MFGRSIIPFSAEAHFRVVAISFFYGGLPRAHFAAALLLIQLATVNGIHESYTKQIYISAIREVGEPGSFIGPTA